MNKKFVNVTSQTTATNSILDSEPEKRITIDVSPDFTQPPHIEFLGMWTGRDMQILPRLIFRAYKQYNLNKRKEFTHATHA